MTAHSLSLTGASLLSPDLSEQCTNDRAMPSMSGQGYQTAQTSQALLTQQVSRIKENKGRMDKEEASQKGEVIWKNPFS